MESDIERIAAGLSEKRRREGLSVRQVGEATGVSFSTVARFERGEGTTPLTRARLAAWVSGEPMLKQSTALEQRVGRLERDLAELRETLGQRVRAHIERQAHD